MFDSLDGHAAGWLCKANTAQHGDLVGQDFPDQPHAFLGVVLAPKHDIGVSLQRIDIPSLAFPSPCKLRIGTWKLSFFQHANQQL